MHYKEPLFGNERFCGSSSWKTFNTKKSFLKATYLCLSIFLKSCSSKLIFKCIKRKSQQCRYIHRYTWVYFRIPLFSQSTLQCNAKTSFKIVPLGRTSSKSLVFTGQKHGLIVHEKPKHREKDAFPDLSELMWTA